MPETTHPPLWRNPRHCASLLLLPVLLLLLLLPAFMPVARAADTWSTPHPGMRLLVRTASGPVRIFALQIDNCARGISHRATMESERQRTPTSFRNLVSAQAAMNGDFFSYTGYWPIGLSIGNGTKWVNDNSAFGFLVGGHDRMEISPVGQLVNPPESWMKNAVAGHPTLVWNGQPQYGATSPSHCPERHPRTVVGLSRNRRYLWLVIVDGRTTLSRGMTCNELADLMVDLGAWTALNWDGGGSSALSVSGLGTVNSPSDGSERVVANHWAVFASGTGAPDSCDLWMDDLVVNSGVLNQGRSTDINGDGRSDFCARGASGFRCYLSTGSGFQSEPLLISGLSDAAGFNTELTYSTIRTGDINGDGRMDVCARSTEGIRCWPSTGTGFGDPVHGPSWADSVGWGKPEHASTFRLADIDGDGKDDFCALAGAGWICVLSTGSGIGTQIQGPAWTGANGWHQPWHYGTIRTGDLNGDGKVDVCARGAAGMVCAHSEGNGFSATFPGPAWNDAAGFTNVAYWSTIRMVDIDNDGKMDLCARTATGIECYRSLGDGTFGPAIAGPQLSDASGWKDMDNASTIRFADINGDGLPDICARANAGIRCWLNNGSGWSTQVNGPDWNEASGWDDFRFYTSFHLGDIDNDGMADICGRDASGVKCHLSLGTSFGAEITGPQLSDASGWAAYPYFSTIRFGGQVPVAQCEPVAEDDVTCDGIDDNCNGQIDEDADASCDDGDPCNGMETCLMANCIPGDPPDCGERGCLTGIGCCPEGTILSGNTCLRSSCEEDSDCDDGNACNGIETCDPDTSSCVAGETPDCGDRGCVPATGCCPPGSSVSPSGNFCIHDGNPKPSGKDGGCSCATGKSTPPVTAFPLFLALLALLWFRKPDHQDR